MKSKKRTITETLEDVSPYEFETTLGDLHARIGKWIAKYGHGARLDWDPHYHYDYESTPTPRYNLLKDREETDTEFASRIEKEELDRAAREAGELAELERLQAKYGKK